MQFPVEGTFTTMRKHRGLLEWEDALKERRTVPGQFVPQTLDRQSGSTMGAHSLPADNMWQAPNIYWTFLLFSMHGA